MSTRLPKILAVDFDGTLVEDKYPDIGTPNEMLFRHCKKLREKGVKVILWTCRNGSRLDEAVQYCHLKGLDFDTINANLPEVIDFYGDGELDTRKVYADIYLDDKALNPYEQMLYWSQRLGVSFDGLGE
jgi:hydroxymethylpyrimidine pyrophosphatase-like HAD family hydrolase